MLSPTLPITCCTFTFKALQAMTNISFSASLWHGQLGRALRTVVSCVQPSTKCKQCMLLHSCDYAFLFEGVRPLNAKKMRRYENIPVPYVFRCSICKPMNVQTGELFSVSMNIFGVACHKLPSLIKSMENIGQVGLEKQRFKAALNSVSILDQQYQEVLLFANGLLLSHPTPSLVTIPPCPSFVRLQWSTPYRAKVVNYHQQSQHIAIDKLMMAIIRRISLLQEFYTDSSLAVDFKALKQLSLQLANQCIKTSLQPCQGSRYSAKHKQRVPTSGVTGYLDLSLQGVETLWDYLFLGQFLNIGQNASMGYGRYQLMALYE